MDKKEIRETQAWQLYEKGRNFHRMNGIYTDTDKNYRMYNGNQWEHAKLGDVEPVQKNFIKPIVDYKMAVIHDNLYEICFSSMNFENRAFRGLAEEICAMLETKAMRVWEKDKMDFKGRRVTRDAAVNDEGIIYVRYDEETQMPVNEIIKKNDIYYGNENDDNIQEQPYILVRHRMPVINARDLAASEGLSEEKCQLILGDNDNFEESGEAAKREVDPMVTIITKMWKESGTVHFSMSTRWVDIMENENSGLTYYPIAHYTWEEKEGSARGEGEVRYLIPNQIEVNRTEVRRVLTVKYQAYPQKIINSEKIANPSAANKVGAVIKVKGGQSVEDVAKLISTLHPAQMSPDVRQLQEDLINVTRELAGAGEAATGQINPEAASGRAILAVMQASQSPINGKKENYKSFLEDLAKIWLDMWITYSPEGLRLEVELIDDETGEDYTELVTIPQVTLQGLKAAVRVDVTPKSPFDKYAQEQSIENLFQAGMFNIEKLQELKVYAQLLDENSVMPKAKIEEAIEIMEAEQQKIAEIEAQAQILQQRAAQFINGDPELQAQQILEAQEPTEEEVIEAAEQDVAEEEKAIEEEQLPEE